MRFLYLVLCVGLVSGCMHKTGTPSAALQKRCAPILEEILQVQDLRALNNLALQSKRRSGMLTDEITTEWRMLENDLATRANELYAKAERKRCFRGLEKMLTSS